MNVNGAASFFLVGLMSLFSGYDAENGFSKKIVIKNDLPFERTGEIVSVDLHDHKIASVKKNFDDLTIKDAQGKSLITQLVDTDSDGTPDELLFQANVAASSSVNYTLVIDKNNYVTKLPAINATYARFVPERTDDFAWENDKVAFRTYGPLAQRLAEQGNKEGTLSSGIDLWLKKVSHPIIDFWYSKNEKEPGYYHSEHGQGYDGYHVGRSRGTGGTGIWEKDSLFTSKNFYKYKIIAVGPLRTIFELHYPSWSPYGVQETKRISLDLGSNFTKFENTVTSKKRIPNYAIGITLHDQKGKIALDAKNGIFRHWEPTAYSFLGEGIVVAPDFLKDAFDHRSAAVDQSHILVLTKPKNNKVVYYSGFAWMSSGQVSSVEEWDTLLEKQAHVTRNPLIIKIQ